MDTRKIELLVELWFMSNMHNAEDFDEAKRESERDNAWNLSSESQALMAHIDRLRVHSHIVSRYHLSVDIVHLILAEFDDTHELHRDATDILYLLDLLRANTDDGPKAYWNIGRYFFNKIDSFLSVVVSKPQISAMYTQCCPLFLVENKPTALVPPKLPTGILTMSSVKSRPRSSRAINANSFQSIQSQLMFGGHTSPEVLRQRHYKRDLLDRVAEKCSDMCTCDCCDGCTECVHNMDRFYFKLALLIVLSLICCSSFTIGYYRYHGLEQANDAMFLSLEAIGDRAKDHMSGEVEAVIMFNFNTERQHVG